MSQQIEDALISMGRDLKTQIHEAGGQNASAATIRSLKTTMTSQMNGLYNDIVNWEAARVEYQQAKHLLPNQVGKILPGYNDALIHMFDAAEDGKNNMMLSLDPETKHWRISLIGEGTNSDGSPKINETVDVTDWSTKHADKDYFKKVEDMGKNPYAAAKRVIKDLAPKFTDDKGAIDRVKLTEYITKGDGQSALLPYIDEEDKQGHWRLISGLDANSNWEEYDKSYSDEAFLNKVIDNAILELPKMNFSSIDEKVIDPVPYGGKAEAEQIPMASAANPLDLEIEIDEDDSETIVDIEDEVGTEDKKKLTKEIIDKYGDL